MKKCYSPATILLPDFKKTDAKKWAVIACDQFTSEPEYWEDVSRIVDGAPSTLDLFLPEVYLSQAAERLPKIHKQMKNYLENILIPHENVMMSIERTLSDGSVRNGLILAVDLESYDYAKGSTALTRASERTVLERLPPRVAIRRQADIELPHTMIFIDDPDKKVIEPLENATTEFLYDTDLMKGGGHIRGRFLTDEEQAQVSKALDELITPEAMLSRYGDASLAPLLFAVGDGNHSLASAKAFYEELKMNIGEEAKDHPARYALCEIVNIHDEAIKFEPIYRVMFGVDPRDVLNSLKEYAMTLDGTEEAQGTLVISKDFEEIIGFAKPRRQLTVGTLEDFIKDYLKTHEGSSCDYIHGENSVRNLSAKPGAVGFLFEGIQKEQFFPTVMREGALPRKTFSMGHAEDKRYYLEARKIKN
jgi:hypothetical protein